MGNFFGNKMSIVGKKVKLKAIIKKMNLSIDVDMLVDIIEQNNLQSIYNWDFNKDDTKIIESLILACYEYDKNNFKVSLANSFSVVEYVLRSEYAKKSFDASSLRAVELLKWARNRKILNDKNFNLLMAFRSVRNDIVHKLKSCSKEEAKICLDISIELYNALFCK